MPYHDTKIACNWIKQGIGLSEIITGPVIRHSSPTSYIHTVVH